MTGYAAQKLATGVDNVRGCKRVLSSMLGYFIHDFIALRSTWQSDIPMVVHHVFGIVLVTGVCVSVWGGGRCP